MQLAIVPNARPIALPWYASVAAVTAALTGIMAIPVGLMFITDPSGAGLGLPHGWIEGTPFGTYFVPGLYLLFVNSLGMLALATLIFRRNWIAPWLSAILGVGLITWILVQLAVMPETMILQWIFLSVGLFHGFVALFWLRRTGQLRVW
jgi:hypothetical protein